MTDSLRGSLLVASPALMDENFRRAIILVIEHSEDGAMGLVLNRESEACVADAVPDLEGLVDGDLPVDIGGPVASDQVVILCDFEDPADAGLVVFETIGLPATDSDLGTLATAVRRARVFAGHAGWGPGQLEAELEEESWIIEPAAERDVFPGGEPDAERDLWAEVWRRKGGLHALVATMPLDPSLN